MHAARMLLHLSVISLSPGWTNVAREATCHCLLAGITLLAAPQICHARRAAHARRLTNLARRAPCHRETWPRTRGDLCREAGEEGEPVPAASPRLLPGREVHTSESQSTRAEGSRAGGAGRDRGGSEGEVRTMS